VGSKRILQGTVVSDKMDKTIVVSVERHKKHRLYHKIMAVTTRYKAHDEANACHLGDVVRIVEAPPTSKEKRWRLLEVVARGDVAEVRPEAIGREIEATTQVAPKTEARAEGDPEAAEEDEE
jgi:small subunit ribosomal protein S17